MRKCGQIGQTGAKMSISTTMPSDQAIQFVHDETDISWPDASGFVSAVTSVAVTFRTGIGTSSIKRVTDGYTVTRHDSPCVTSVHVCRVTGTMTRNG